MTELAPHFLPPRLTIVFADRHRDDDSIADVFSDPHRDVHSYFHPDPVSNRFTFGRNSDYGLHSDSHADSASAISHGV